jgi:4-amino-4-deoxy-L-arabinose transferase-like glycosyltransferase
MTRWVVASLIAVLVAVNLICVFLDRTPFLQDSGRFLIQSNCFAEVWTGRQSFFNCHLDRTDKKPEIWLALGGLTQLLSFEFGQQDLVILTEQFFLAILLAAVYAAVRRLVPHEPPAVALLTVFMTGVSPIVFGMSKKYMGDLPLAAMVWLALALLPASERFQRRGRAAAFGVACGLGMLMRPTFALFLAGPALVVLIAALREKGTGSRALLNAGVAALIAATLAGPWYMINFRHGYQYHLQFGGVLPASWRDFGGLAGDYLRLIGAEQLGWGFAALTMAGLARLLIVRDLRARFGPLLAAGFVSAAPSFLYFSSARIAHARYAIAWVPFLALIAALGILADAVREARSLVRSRRAMASLAVGWGLFQFGFMSFTSSPWTERPPALERVMGFPGYEHYPGDTHVGLFRLDRVGWGDREFCRLAVNKLRPGVLHVLLLTDRRCRDAVAFHAVKWCVLFDQNQTQMIRTDLAADRVAAAAATAQQWAHLALLHYADYRALERAAAVFDMDRPDHWLRIFQRPAPDGFVALYRNLRAAPDAPPPPTIAEPADCVDYANCRDWCVRLDGAAVEKK